MIQDFRGIHEGADIAVLANGRSLLRVEWNRLAGMKLFGLNESWTEVQGDYHLSVHGTELLDAPTLPILFTSESCSSDLPASRIVRIKALGTDGVIRWSNDLANGVYFKGVLFFALQVAAYLIGRGRIYIFGLDWKGAHHNSDREIQPNMKRWQGDALSIAKHALERQKIKVFNCNPDSECTVFEKINLGFVS